MAKKNTEVKPNPQLLISRQEAKTLLLDRIGKGQDLLKVSIRTFQQLDEERKKYFNWDKYNSQLLQNIFSNTKISEEYSWFGMFVTGGNADLGRDIQEHFDDINSKISRLESIIERLELFQVASSANNPSKEENEEDNAINKSGNVFIIHGHDETRLLELEKIVRDDFHLNPVILKDKPNGGSTTIIEKFELYAPECSFAIALFTPDDQVKNGDNVYLQARPNVIYELGWFCAKISRKNVLLVLKEGTDIFSDFQGILQLRFKEKVSELYRQLHKEFQNSSLIK